MVEVVDVELGGEEDDARGLLATKESRVEEHVQDL